MASICNISICMDTYIHIYVHVSTYLKLHVTHHPLGFTSACRNQNWISSKHHQTFIRPRRPIICWPTKLEINPINGVSSNVQKLLGQSEDRERLEFHEAWPKVNQYVMGWPAELQLNPISGLFASGQNCSTDQRPQNTGSSATPWYPVYPAIAEFVWFSLSTRRLD